MEFLEKVEQSGTWPQQACTRMFFLIPKNVASGWAGRAHANVESLVGSLENKVAAEVSS